jgi:imidazole glycerol-phosphate synthase subunit HisH
LNETADERPRIVVADYGAGNLHSVARALEITGADVLVTEDADAFAGADALVFPGDGAAASAMRGLRERGMIEPLRRFVASGRPFLGVCLGQQVLMGWSDEDGGVACLGVIPGRVVRLPPGLKVPHIGWNQVERRRWHRLFEDVPDGANFYFVHSYVVVPDDPDAVVASTDYGGAFASVVAQGNVVATQFHPEKSAGAGLVVYRNFVKWARDSARATGQAIREYA